MGFWEDPGGGLVLNLAASVLWDGAKTFNGFLRSRRDTSLGSEIATALDVRAGVHVAPAKVDDWLADDGFWLLAAQLADADSRVGDAVAAQVAAYCSIDASDEITACLSTVLFEISRRDPELRVRLHQARVARGLDVLEHSLGYVLEEVLGAVFGRTTEIIDRVGQGFASLEA